MKTIVLWAFFAIVSAETMQGPTVLVNSPALQNLFDCRGRQDENCLKNIASTSDNYFKAIEEACPKCSYEQKFKMASWIDAYHKGVSIEEANKLYNPDRKYFDTAFINK